MLGALLGAGRTVLGEGGSHLCILLGRLRSLDLNRVVTLQSPCLKLEGGLRGPGCQLLGMLLSRSCQLWGLLRGPCRRLLGMPRRL